MMSDIENLIQLYNKFGLNENNFIENKIIELYEYNINYFLRKHKTKSYYEDLKQELRICLLKCIRKYNPNKCTKFSTYVFRSMINIMDRKIKSQKLIRLPSNVHDNLNYSEILSNIIDNNGVEYNIYDDIECQRYNINELKCSLPKYKGLKKFVLEKRIQGYSDSEIAKMSSKSTQWISTVRQEIKNDITKGMLVR